jgi:hypothetical protein
MSLSFFSRPRALSHLGPSAVAPYTILGRIPVDASGPKCHVRLSTRWPLGPWRTGQFWILFYSLLFATRSSELKTQASTLTSQLLTHRTNSLHALLPLRLIEV